MQLLSPQTRALLQKAQRWYFGLNPRERWMLIGLLAVVLLVGAQRGFGAYQAHKHSLMEQMSGSQNELIWLEEQRLQLTLLGNQGAVQLSENELYSLLDEVGAELKVQIQISPIAGDVDPLLKLTWQGNELSRLLYFLSALSQRGADVQGLEVLRNGNLLNATVELGG